MESTMKRIIITTALLLGTVLSAQARPVAKYYDLIRPNGHMRSDAVHQADLGFCYAQTGQSRFSPDGPAFKKCMLTRGYRFLSQQGWGQTHGSGSGDAPYIDNSPSPDVPAPPPFEQPAPVVPPSPTPDNPLCGGGLC
jgi:hypothetical protein